MKKQIGETFEGSVDKFVQKANMLHQRAAALKQHVKESSTQQKPTTLESFEELEIALEELYTAEEELKAQNEELAITRAVLEEERHRYHDLFEFAPDGYLVTDEAALIQEVNLVAAGMLNVSQRFLIGKPLINYIPQQERRAFRYRLNQLCQVDSLQEWEIRVSPRGGVDFDAAVTVSTVLDSRGNSTSWRWLLRDITARKQTEEKIRNIHLQNLQLQESARLKSHFLAIMSHELRSPMNAIIGFSQLLLRYPHHPLVPKQENMVERILSNGRHLLSLIDDILDFSKLEAGGLKLKLEEFNLAELVTATTEELRSLAEQKNLALQVHLNLPNPVVVNDRTRLRQVLVNLLSNAIKFTEIGSVQIEVCELLADRVAIAVKDTGIGIAEVDIERIFEEFRQLNQTIARQHGGTGLGLAITDQLVGMMQGKITVESQLNQGSTFRVEFPRQVTE